MGVALLQGLTLGLAEVLREPVLQALALAQAELVALVVEVRQKRVVAEPEAV